MGVQAVACWTMMLPSRVSSSPAKKVPATATRHRNSRSNTSAGTSGRKASNAAPSSPSSGSIARIRSAASDTLQNGGPGTR